MLSRGRVSMAGDVVQRIDVYSGNSGAWSL
jgi:hypothetical protein